MCNGGTCTSWPVATSSTATTPVALVSDGASVIWADTGLMKILQIPISGVGTPTTLSQNASFSSIPNDTWTPLALGSGTVTWVTSTNVWKATVGTGGSGVMLPFTFPSSGGLMGLSNLAMNTGATRIGVMNEFSGSSGPAFEFYDCLLSGSTCTDVSATSSPLGYYQQAAAGNASAMFFADLSLNEIRLYNFGSGSVGILETAAQPIGGGIAIDSTNVYWAWHTSANTNQIVKAPLVGGTITPLATFPSGVVAIQGMATDGTNVYFTTNGTPPQVGYAPVAGCCPSSSNCCGTTALVAATNPTGVTAAGGMIFWIDGATITGLAAP
jgi:hypothetical protein